MSATKLLIKSRDGSERIETLASSTASIGRGPESDILITDLSVSRSHASVCRVADSYEIRDVDSRHGVVVNGQPILGPTPIGPGDQIRLGAVNIEVLPPVELTDVDFRMDPDSISTMEPSKAPALGPLTSWDEISLDPHVHMDPVVSARLLAFLDAVSIAIQRPFPEVMQRIVSHSLKIFGQADRACLILIEQGKPIPKVARFRHAEKGAVRVSSTVVRQVIETRRSLLSYNAHVDFSTQSIIQEGIFSVMCVPIVAENEALGVLYLDTGSPGRVFSEQDLELFTLLANASAAYIKHHLLLEEAVQRRILEEQMRAAGEIQRRLLALCEPEVPGYELHLRNLPCLAAGGDYVDTMWCGDKLFLALGDVSGKGIPAAMLTGTLQAAVHAQAVTSTNLSDIAFQVNTFLYQRTSPEKFATLFLGCLDADSGHLSYVNAGHCAPVVFRRDSHEPERLGSTGLIIGAFPDALYPVAETTLAPGDLMIVFTDGFYEQRSASDGEYEEERLIDFLLKNRNADLAATAKALEEEVMRFAEGVEQQDDMTQLLVRRLDPSCPVS